MLQNSFARLRFIAATGIVCVLGVVLQEAIGGCFHNVQRPCSECLMMMLPSGMTTSCRDCGCDSQTEPSQNNDVFCNCGAEWSPRAGSVTVQAGAPCPNPNQKNNGCKDDWALKTKPDGTLDSVLCATYKACNLECYGAFSYDSNGQRVWRGYNTCAVDPTAQQYRIECNQVELQGNPC